MRRLRTWIAVGCFVGLALAGMQQDRAWAEGPTETEKVFRAGAAAVDISPKKLPAIISGGFLEKQADRLHDPLFARALVLDDGATRVAIVVVDTLFMPREMLDRVKQAAAETTGIREDRMLICATHTHSAPSVAPALGTGVDEDYAQRLPGWLVEVIQRAAARLAPARVGWGAVADGEHTNCRRWIRRPDRIGTDPFGKPTVRAMMHPGYQNPDYVGPAGPEDPGLTILAVQTPEGRPVAVLANYSMHYFGAAPVSADYFGRFAKLLPELIGAAGVEPAPVVMMSQGTSGDLHWMDYSQARKSIDLDTYARQVAEVAAGIHKTIQYHDWVPLAMAERTLTLKRRVPDAERLAWAKAGIEKLAGAKPKSIPEVYCYEQIYLHNEPERELKLQAVRIGELGIAAIPNEVYGITGLKLKAQSPLVPTFNIELANGSEGYIPPPEQHTLGGYTTWPARSAALEVQAEPKIVETLLALLEEVAGRPRRKVEEPAGPYAQAVLASKPLAYWRMAEFQGTEAADATGRNHSGTYEGGFALYLEGPPSADFCGPGYVNRAVHFAGGRMKAALPGLGAAYTVELWFWNGLPEDARAVTGYLFSRGADGDAEAAGDHLGLGGRHAAGGKLFFYNGNRLNEILTGKTPVAQKTWNHVALVREGKNVRVYLNGAAEPEISGEATPGFPARLEQVFLGGRNDHFANFEGKIDEVAVYDRALDAAEIVSHYTAAAQQR